MLADHKFQFILAAGLLFLRFYKFQTDFCRKTASFRKDLLQYPGHLCRPDPIDHIVIHMEHHHISVDKLRSRTAQDIILHHAKLPKFLQNTVFVEIIQLLRRILGRETEFFMDLHAH